jgi:hypothetical protein
MCTIKRGRNFHQTFVSRIKTGSLKLSLFGMKFLRVCYARLPLVLFCLFFAHLIDTNSQRAASEQKPLKRVWSRIKSTMACRARERESTYTLGLRFIRHKRVLRRDASRLSAPAKLHARDAQPTEYHNTQSANYTHPRRRRCFWRASCTKESKWLRRFFIRASIC